jgi:hypothetical protein
MVMNFTVARVAIVVALVLLVAPVTSPAQESGKVVRIGYLALGEPPSPAPDCLSSKR